MGLFSEQKPFTAVTNWVDQLCSEQYEEDDYTGVPDLCEVARLQNTGFVSPPIPSVDWES
jgi:LAS seventeen-binding protein 5